MDDEWGVKEGMQTWCEFRDSKTKAKHEGKQKMPGIRTEPLSCTAMMACLREMAANLRCTSHPFCLRRGKYEGGTWKVSHCGRGVSPGFGFWQAFREKSVSYRPMTRSFLATSNVRSTSPPSPSCMSFPTTLLIFFSFA